MRDQEVAPSPEPRTPAAFPRGAKILITGGTGHLGSALIHSLVRDRGVPAQDIRVLYLEGQPADAVADLPGLDLKPGDILRPEDVRRAVASVDFIFHLAASTSFDPRQKENQWRVNIEGTRNVLEAARRSPRVRRLIHVGTVNTLGVPRPAGSVGDIETANPYTSRPRLHAFGSAEEILAFADRARESRAADWVGRIGIGYFDSKLAAQELVSRFTREGGLDTVSVLPGTMFGPYDRLIGNGILLLKIARGEMPGVLQGGISAVHIMDVVDGLILALALGRTGERYILTADPQGHLYLKDMAAIMADVLRSRFPDRRIRRRFRVFPGWAALPAAGISEVLASLSRGPCLLSRAAVRAGSQPLFYSCAKARRELGYEPRRTFRRAVEELAAYYEEYGLFQAKGRTIDR